MSEIRHDASTVRMGDDPFSFPSSFISLFTCEGCQALISYHIICFVNLFKFECEFVCMRFVTETKLSNSKYMYSMYLIHDQMKDQVFDDETCVIVFLLGCYCIGFYC